jgi:hypothetical protein
MRIVLKVTSSNEYCDGGCEFALVDLTHELATLALRRIAVLRELKVFDPDILETYYWTHFVDCYFSPYADLSIDDNMAESASIPLVDALDQLQIEEGEVVCVPDAFQVPSGQIANVECGQMLVRQDGIAFTAIPKHASFHVETVEVPFDMLVAALAISPSTTQA